MTGETLRPKKKLKLPSVDVDVKTKRSEAPKEEESSPIPGNNGKCKPCSFSSLPFPLRFGKSLNLWFWSTFSNKSAEHVISVIREDANMIETVDIGAALWDHLEAAELNQVLYTIGGLYNLKWLSFSLLSPAGPKCKSISINLLSSILTKTKKLEFLLLKNACLVGSKSEWLDFTCVLKTHQKLLQVSLENFSFQDSQIGLGELTLALVCIPTLQVVEIMYIGQPMTTTSWSSKLMSALTTLLRGALFLRVLRLSGLDFQDEDIAEFSLALRHHQMLQRLCLWETTITDQGLHYLAEALAGNNSVVILNLNDNKHLTSRGCEALFDRLQKPTLAPLCKKNGDNISSLQEVYISCRDMNKECRRALLGFLRRNVTVRKVEVCFSWPRNTTVNDLAFFQREVKAIVNSQSVLEYVHLFSDPLLESPREVCLTDNDAAAMHLQWDLLWRPAKEEDGDENCDTTETADVGKRER